MIKDNDGEQRKGKDEVWNRERVCLDVSKEDREAELNSLGVGGVKSERS